MKPILTLNEDKTASVWVTRPPLSDGSQEDRAILSKDELERADRFRFQADRSAFVTAHALVRRCLSHYSTDVDPTAWAFTTNAFGRPLIKDDMNPKQLRFSLSHTRKLVACMVCIGADCGVDVEAVGRVSDPVSLAKSQFSVYEAEAIDRSSGASRDALFTKLWCLKEAYIKGRGVGLSMPLRTFSFKLDDDLNTPIRFSPPDDDDADNWRFWLLRPLETHFAAAALKIRKNGQVENQGRPPVAPT